MSSFDPITLKVLWDKLIYIAEEAGATLIRTSFSPIVREANDFACALMDANGDSLGQASYAIPSFIGTMPITAKHFLRKFPPPSLRPGDVLITNDPWLATGHLPDLTIITPIFHKDRLVAMAGTIAHTPDIGGLVGLGLANEVFEEGLCIPMSKLFVEGRANENLLDIIRSNVRVPEQTIGDIMAMVSSNETAENRLREIMDEYGLEDVEELSREVNARSEEAMRSTIEEMPDGTYSHEAVMDGYEEPIHIRAAVTISGSDISVDYTGSSQQNQRGINSVMNYTYAYTSYPLKCVTNPSIPNNTGCFRPLKVSAPEGSIVNAKFPAAVNLRHFTGHMLHAAIFGALAEVVPDRVMAYSGSAPLWFPVFIGQGYRGESFVQFITANGGTGAYPAKDGETCSYPSNLSNIPLEMIENYAPIVIDAKELIPGSAGAGRYRGGWGQRIAVSSRSEQPIKLAINVDRIKHPALGLLGGRNGAPGRVAINGHELPFSKGVTTFQPGDEVVFCYPGGGGLHEPETRDPELVLKEVRDGLISPREAAEISGVAVKGDGCNAEIDVDETERLRKKGSAI
jgi:N-methylhydantoinase B